MGLALACVLTILIETPFLALFGYRDKDELTVIVCANAVTNLLLNLAWTTGVLSGGAALVWAEAAVVCAEYAAYALAFGPSARLFLLTLAANCISYGFSYPLSLFLSA